MSDKFDGIGDLVLGDEDEMLVSKLKKASKGKPSLAPDDGKGTEGEGAQVRTKPGPVPMSKEPIVQVTFKVPESIGDAIFQMGEDTGLGQKGLILSALRDRGIDIPDIQITGPKRRRRLVARANR